MALRHLDFAKVYKKDSIPLTFSILSLLSHRFKKAS